MSSRLITDFYFSDAPVHTIEDRHKHNVYQMIYVTEGSLSCEIAGNKILCKAPAILFIGNYEPHIISGSTDPYVRYVLTLDPYRAGAAIRPEVLQTVFSFHPVGFLHTVDVTPIKDEVRILMESLYREWSLPEKEKLKEGEEILLSALLYRLYQLSPSHFASKKFGAVEMIVASVRMELECNFAEPLDLDALAERYHVSRYYLSHAFKQVTSYSLKEYLMLCRISFACQHLADATRSVREIAEASGFHDMSNFSRSFKDIIGMTPSEFRKKTAPSK